MKDNPNNCPFFDFLIIYGKKKKKKKKKKKTISFSTENASAVQWREARVVGGGPRHYTSTIIYRHIHSHLFTRASKKEHKSSKTIDILLRLFRT